MEYIAFIFGAEIKAKQETSFRLVATRTILFLRENQWELTSCFAIHPVFSINPSVSQADCSACCLLHADFLLDLLSDTEDGGDMFPGNVG
jgi:hypothetical protein